MPNIILIGFKNCGKSTIGKSLAQKLNYQFTDLDEVIENLYLQKNHKNLAFREIYKKHGSEYFRNLEFDALKKLANKKNHVLALGGGTPFNKCNQDIIKKLGEIIYLQVDSKKLIRRIKQKGIPAFIENKINPDEEILNLIKSREPLYMALADFVIDNTPDEFNKTIQNIIKILNIT